MVVVPLAAAADLPKVRESIAGFAAQFGVEPVVAYAPPGCGLLAMNTPRTRGPAHETTCKADTIGRVVNGAVIWPRASLRAEAQRRPLPAGDAAAPSAPESSLAIAATMPGEDGLGWAVLTERFDVDEDGFLRLRLEAPE